MSNFQFQRFDLLLRTYEEAAERAAANGLDIVSQNYEENWDYLQAVFFSTTILTTIGTVSCSADLSCQTFIFLDTDTNIYL